MLIRCSKTGGTVVLMSDPTLLALIALAAASVGGFAHRLWLDRRRRSSRLCPTCFGPLDEDGSSEAWSARVEPAEGRVLVDPDDETSGFLVLDEGRVGRVDVVPAEPMLLADDAPRFAPDDGGRDE
jgi:hypothetical protein